TTVGLLLAERRGIPFLDSDDLHPASNVAKMAAGQPLTDSDRWPWLEAVGEALAAASATGLVVACSALKRSYRAKILQSAPGARFIQLSGSRELLSERLGARTGHFMPADLLESQLHDLEPLANDEPGFSVSVAANASDIVDEIAGRLHH
ncbi:MAG: gluconokinase, partial [Rhodoglobus sp.]|nr:gluconokinase [Rhodoglobus sp.]